ncbi:MAG: endonuclease III [Candidatus Omnitrophota bacterium]
MSKVRKILDLLKAKYPRTRTALAFVNPLEILVATILSAQCTDKRVNTVTASLFKKYRSLDDYADADRKRFETAIRSTGFYRNKAKNIINAARKIRRDYGRRVPDTMDGLLSLPGVARKTANIVLYNGYGIVSGIAVDTHVKRLSMRLGLSEASDPVKIERDLMKLIPAKEWGRVSDLLIRHGREVCHARSPKCQGCMLKKTCPSFGKI